MAERADGGRKAEAAARRERLARALRENLRRRKARKSAPEGEKPGNEVTDGPDRA